MPITYDQSLKKIVVTEFAEEAECACIDIYNADINAINGRFLHDGVIDSDPDIFSLDEQPKPADSLAVPLKIVCTPRAGATCDISGTDAWGVAISENGIDISSGSATTTERFATVNVNGITVNGLQNGDDFDVYQDRWGVVWKLTDNVFAFDAKLYIGNNSVNSYFRDINKVIIFKAGIGSPPFRAEKKSYLTLGVLVDETAKTTTSGCVMIFEGGGYAYLSYQQCATRLYSCYFVSVTKNAVRLYVRGGAKAYNCMFSRFYEIQSQYGSDFFNCYATDGRYGINRADGDIERLTVNECTYGVEFAYSGNMTIRNLYARKCNYIARCQSLYADADCYFINPDSDTWSFYWVGGSNAKVYRQYEFDAHCQDKAGNDLSGVSVVAEYISPYGEAFSVSTDVNGDIETQTVDHGWFDAAHQSTEQLKTPLKVTYSKPGYQTVVKYYDMDEKTKDRVVMHKAVGVFLSFGSPVVNLKKSDPENKNVMVL